MDDNEANDILQKLSIDETNILIEIYKKHQNSVPHIYSFLKTVIKWKSYNSSHEYFQIYAPFGKWHDDGCFVAIGHFPWKIIILYTLDESVSGFKKLRNSLIKTKRFDYVTNSIVYYAIDEKHRSIIEEAMKVLNLKKVKHEDTNIWYLPKDATIKIYKNCNLNNVLMERYKVMNLSVDNISTINTHWPHREHGSEEYIRILIEMNGGYGIYTRQENQLIAWIMRTSLGTIGLLHVLEKHRRQGLATALIAMLSNNVIKEELSVSAIVLTNNIPSKKMFNNAGFENLLPCVCMTFK